MSTAPNSPPVLPYDQLGGESKLQVLVDLFYDLMDLEPKYSALRQSHSATLDGSRQKLFMFLSGWLGGPGLYMEAFGHPRLKARHMPFSIGVTERNQWVACMVQAMQQLQIEPSLAQQLTISFFNTADWMRNQVDPVEGAATMPGVPGLNNEALLARINDILKTYGLSITS